MMATARRAMPDAPMSNMELRLERVNRAAALDRAVSEMFNRYTNTRARLDVLYAKGYTAEETRCEERARTRQYVAFHRLLDALTRMAQSTDADLQRSVTRS